ncbi:MAG: NUDIX domain-containing protein [Marinilabiliaceae bacterium]
MVRVIQFILPLACYFVVEQLWGYAWGAVAGIVLSLTSVGICVAKGEKLNWKSVAADVGLVLLFFIGDMVAERVSPSASPVVTSTLIAALAFALSTKKGSFLTGTMIDSVRPMTSANPFAMKLIRDSLFRMGLWALFAAIIFLITGLNDDTPAARWVYSYLLLTVLLATLATEIVVSRLIRRRYRDTEWVPLMTEDGRTVGGAPRPLVHNGSHWLHAVVHLHVINSKGELLLQLRPMSKKIQPGKWDTAVGGHITFGERLEDALRRETLEEIGLANFKAQFKGHYVWKCEAENEFVFVFTTKSDGPFEPKNVGEVDRLRFWSVSELKAAMGTVILTPNIEKELRDWLLGTL